MNVISRIRAAISIILKSMVFAFWGIMLPQFSFGDIYQVSNGERIAPTLKIAEPGDTIYIHPGEYLENIDIDTPLVLIGKGYPHIKGGYQGHVILVRANNTRIEGLKISECGTRLIEDMACIRVEADSIYIHNNIITQPLHGIYVKGGNYITMSDNHIEGRLDLIPEDRGNGIHLWNSVHNRIIGNEISNVRDGIYFSFANKTEVIRNHIYQVRYGLHYMYSDENTFSENLFENNVAGAALMYSKKILFSKNVFARCRGFRAYGILYQSVDHTEAWDNLVIDNSRGLFFDNCNSNIFGRNDVIDNDLAIQLMGNGEENVIQNNNFINNLSNLLVDTKKTRTTWASDSGGNYWSDYKGFDLDGDGLGDVPHKIQNVFQIIESRIPEVRFYLFSPAAEILEIAERSLPIIELGTEVDPRPQFRAAKNSNVPWSKTEQMKAASSASSALIYLFGGLLPVSFLLYLSRRKNS